MKTERVHKPPQSDSLSTSSVAKILPTCVECLFAGSIFLTMGVWLTLTFLRPRAAGDPFATHMFTTGMTALLLALSIGLMLRAAQYARLLWACIALAYTMLATAISVGRPTEQLGNVATYVLAIGGSLGALKFVVDRNDARRREQATEHQRRHDRIMTEWAGFVANERLICAIHMLEYNDPQLCGLMSALTLEEYKCWKNPLDQILEFLLRLAAGVKAGELDREAVEEAMGWYFDRASSNPHVKKYCEEHGYRGILTFRKAGQTARVGAS